MTVQAPAAEKKKGHGIRDVIAALGQPKVAEMLALGFASGLPFLLTGATFGYWLRDEGTTLTAIAFLSWVGLAYTFKVFWAPAVDRFPPPFLGSLGRRRGWVIFAQILVALGLIGMAAFGAHGPGGLVTIGGFALLVAFASATQDIAVDAWRIESAPDADEQGLITSAFQLGYRVALLVTDALILIFAQHLGWPMSYTIMAALMGVGLFAALRTPEPQGSSVVAAETEKGADKAPVWRVRAATALFAIAAIWMYASGHYGLDAEADAARAGWFVTIFAAVFAAFAAASLLGFTQLVWIGAAGSVLAIVAAAFWGAFTGTDLIGGAHIFWPSVACIFGTAFAAPPTIYNAVVGPFSAFFRAHGAFAAVMLLMISLYRLPEFVIGPVAGPFYHDLGLEKDVVGGIRASVGLVASVVGIAAGGFCAIRLGLVRTLILGAVLQGIGVAAYAVVAAYGADLRLFAAAMASDNFCYAFAGVALVAYMSSLTSLGYTATQYALLSSTYTLFGKFLKGFSGAIVDNLSTTHSLMHSYAIFYVGAGLICIPALVLCIVVAVRESHRLRARAEAIAP